MVALKACLAIWTAPAERPGEPMYRQELLRPQAVRLGTPGRPSSAVSDPGVYQLMTTGRRTYRAWGGCLRLSLRFGDMSSIQITTDEKRVFGGYLHAREF